MSYVCCTTFGPRTQARLKKKLEEAKRDPALLSKAHPCIRLVLEVGALPLAERFMRIGEVGALIESTFQAEVHGPRLSKTMEYLNSAVKWVVPWMEEMPPEVKTPEALSAIRNFRDAVLRCAGRVPGGKDTNCVASLRRYYPICVGIPCGCSSVSLNTRFVMPRRMMKRVTKLVDGARDEASATTSASSKRARDEPSSVASSLAIAEALDQVNTFQDGIFSINQLDKVIKSVGAVLSSDWDLRSDTRVLKCVDRLTKCIENIQKGDVRAKRLAIVKEWKVGQHAGSTSGKSMSKSSSKGTSGSSKKRKHYAVALNIG